MHKKQSLRHGRIFSPQRAQRALRRIEMLVMTLHCLGHYLRIMPKLVSAAECGNVLIGKDFYCELSFLPRFAALPIWAFISKNAHKP